MHRILCVRPLIYATLLALTACSSTAQNNDPAAPSAPSPEDERYRAQPSAPPRAVTLVTANVPVRPTEPPPPMPTPSAVSEDETTFETEGELTPTQESVLKAVVVCVRAASDRGEKSGKPLDVDLTVDAAGRVTDVKLASGYAPSAAKCVKRDLARLRFPARAEGSGVQFVRYPIAELEEEH